MSAVDLWITPVSLPQHFAVPPISGLSIKDCAYKAYYQSYAEKIRIRLRLCFPFRSDKHQQWPAHCAPFLLTWLHHGTSRNHSHTSQHSESLGPSWSPLLRITWPASGVQWQSSAFRDIHQGRLNQEAAFVQRACARFLFSSSSASTSTFLHSSPAIG